MSMGGNPGRERRGTGRANSSHNPFRDISQSGREQLLRDDEELVARALRFRTCPVVLKGPDGAPDFILCNGRVGR